MEERSFDHNGWYYTLTARGNPNVLGKALDLVEQMVKACEMQPVKGCVEALTALVTIRTTTVLASTK